MVDTSGIREERVIGEVVSIAKSASIGGITNIGVHRVGAAEVWVAGVEIGARVGVESKKEKFGVGNLGGGGSCQDLVGGLGVDVLVS